MIASISLSAAALAGCSDARPTEQGLRAPSGAQTALEFQAYFNPATRSFEITQMYGQSSRGLDPANNVQDGNAGSGPANSLELVTTNTFFDLDGTGACGFASSWCADVELRQFYTGPLNDVFAELTSVSPAAGHTGLNSDDGSAFGLSNAFGLWSHGNIAGGNSFTRRWVFGDDGTGFQVTGRVMADLCSDGVQDANETGIDCGGPDCSACGGGPGLSVTFSNTDSGGGSQACIDWNAFRAGLSATSVYATLSISDGTITHTCPGANANTLCQGLRTDTTLTIPCGGTTWLVNNCAASGFWLEVLPSATACQCTLEAAARPCFGGNVSGVFPLGMPNNTCGPHPDQTITVSCIE